MGSAGRTIGILAQLQLPKLHAQRVDQKQSSHQRITLAQNQLDGLSRLNHPHQAGENSEHPALGARWNETRRWRLRIQAAIARAVLGRKDARLAFKAKNGAVNIWLSCQHTCIVDEVASGE